MSLDAFFNRPSGLSPRSTENAAAPTSCCACDFAGMTVLLQSKNSGEPSQFQIVAAWPD
jgi:hypothetical protein